jgi:hypothetical protein
VPSVTPEPLTVAYGLTRHRWHRGIGEPVRRDASRCRRRGSGDAPQYFRAIQRAPFALRAIPVCAPISGALGTMRVVCAGVGFGTLMLILCWEMREF